jgi:DNA-binding response OmpR family regulator
VDDEEPIRDLLREAISGAGWHVDTAADSAEALRLIHDNLYDAAVVDFVLPDMDGVKLHSEIRRLDQELANHTLFISGVAQSEERLQYYGDAGGFMAKPFNVWELLEQLRTVLDD